MDEEEYKLLWFDAACAALSGIVPQGTKVDAELAGQSADRMMAVYTKRFGIKPRLKRITPKG